MIIFETRVGEKKEYLTAQEFSKIWNKNRQMIAIWCRNGRFPGAFKMGGSWFIPADTEYPEDMRYGKFARKLISSEISKDGKKKRKYERKRVID